LPIYLPPSRASLRTRLQLAVCRFFCVSPYLQPRDPVSSLSESLSPQNGGFVFGIFFPFLAVFFPDWPLFRSLFNPSFAIIKYPFCGGFSAGMVPPSFFCCKPAPRFIRRRLSIGKLGGFLFGIFNPTMPPSPFLSAPWFPPAWPSASVFSHDSQHFFGVVRVLPPSVAGSYPFPPFVFCLFFHFFFVLSAIPEKLSFSRRIVHFN